VTIALNHRHHSFHHRTRHLALFSSLLSPHTHTHRTIPTHFQYDALFVQYPSHDPEIISGDYHCYSYTAACVLLILSLLLPHARCFPHKRLFRSRPNLALLHHLTCLTVSPSQGNFHLPDSHHTTSSLGPATETPSLIKGPSHSRLHRPKETLPISRLRNDLPHITRKSALSPKSACPL
jgi:hypothetical protein